MAMGWPPSCSNTPGDAHALAHAANVRSLAVMLHTTEELKRLSDAVWERTRRRLEGLTDEEYRWEPVPGCWSIRTRRDGTSFHEWAPVVHPDPFTTLAWRLWHLIDMYGEDRAPRWLDVPPQGEAVGLDAPDPTPPATAPQLGSLAAGVGKCAESLAAALEQQQLEAARGADKRPWLSRDQARCALALWMCPLQPCYSAKRGGLVQLLRALERSTGRKKDAAAMLGIDARNLGYYLRKHSIGDAPAR